MDYEPLDNNLQLNVRRGIISIRLAYILGLIRPIDFRWYNYIAYLRCRSCKISVFVFPSFQA